MSNLIECIPNFSEGRNPEVISALKSAIEKTDGCYLLHQDSGKAANRTVFTFAGEANAVIEAAYNAIQVASEKIDMRTQEGEHPRIGACDVCPFVPISGITEEELIPMVNQLAQRVAKDFKIPIFFYESSAEIPQRKRLARHRVGNYERLEGRMQNGDWPADLGEYNPVTGGTIMGVRPLLVAYNINLNTQDAKLAQEIAYDLREIGRPFRTENNRTVYLGGMLNKVRAIGWYISDFDRAQVSINLVDYNETGLHKVYTSTQELAKKYGLEVTGSELIGLVPKEAILQAGRDFSKQEGESEEQLIQSAVKGLGLEEIFPFEPEKRILEYVLDKVKRD